MPRIYSFLSFSFSFNYSFFLFLFLFFFSNVYLYCVCLFIQLLNFSKIISLIVSAFTANFLFHWKDFFPEKQMLYPPCFDSRAVCYPTSRIIRDYFSWRQADCIYYIFFLFSFFSFFFSFSPLIFSFLFFRLLFVWIFRSY